MQVFNVLYFLPQYLSQLLVLAFTVDRYIVVCHPLVRQIYCRPSRAVKVLPIRTTSIPLSRLRSAPGDSEVWVTPKISPYFCKFSGLIDMRMQMIGFTFVFPSLKGRCHENHFGSQSAKFAYPTVIHRICILEWVGGSQRRWRH